MQKHMLRSPELLIQKKPADNSSGFPRIGDAAWIKNSKDLQESKAKAPYSVSQNGSIPLLVSMKTAMGQMINISTKAAF